MWITPNEYWPIMRKQDNWYMVPENFIDKVENNKIKDDLSNLANRFKSILDGYKERENILLERCKTLKQELRQYKNQQ